MSQSDLIPHPTPAIAISGRPPAESTLDELIRRTLARPKTLLFSAILSAAGAAAAAYGLGRERQQYEGKLLHTRNTITAPYFQSPTLSSLVQLVVSPKLLEEMRREFKLPDDVASLRTNLGFNIAENDILTVTLVRHDAAEAEKVLNRLMDRFANEAEEIRNSGLRRFTAQFEQDAAAAQASYDEARRRQQEFLDAHQLNDPNAFGPGNTTLEQSMTELELSFETARSVLLSAQAKRSHLAEALGETGDRVVANKVVADPESGDQSPVELTSIVPTRAGDIERRTILRDQIKQRQDSATYATKLRVKKDELERARKLYERRLISGAEVDKLAGEIAILEAEQSASIKKLVADLETVEGRIDKSIRRDDAASLLDGGSADQYLDASASPQRVIASLDLEILGIEEQVKHLEKMLNAKKEAAAQIGSLHKQFAPLADDVQIKSKEWERMQQLVQGFHQAANSGAELTIVQPAALAFDGVRSNYAKIFAAAFAAGMIVLTGPRLLWDWRKISAGQ